MKIGILFGFVLFGFTGYATDDSGYIVCAALFLCTGYVLDAIEKLKGGAT